MDSDEDEDDMAATRRCRRCGREWSLTLLYRLPQARARYLCEACWLDWTEGLRWPARRPAA
jgi:NMD protein affecting ribosome stability and mRNA decay